MLIPIRLEIQSSIDPGEREDVQSIEQDLKGHFEKRDKHWVLRYTEKPGTEEEVRTTVKAGEEEVVVIRQGMVAYRTTYRPGSRTYSLIETPGGTSEMEINTLDYQWTGDEGSGSIRFSFQLRMEGEEMGRYQLQIQWTEVPA
ncbi:DUF1934 domain-containing protein [Paludifilum halophilum]|uniref:DUF1934 domain-containing protein n=1 Tax=Paludifilum halophilum TaxID=1642702 RepID=UPI00146C91F8|nr:DUF1934 domain-containing protein [Paludifilum halophilum]